MTQETYRFAYEEATSELLEILAQFEQLRLRKSQMEEVVEALRPLLSDAPAAAISAEILAATEPLPFLVQETEHVETIQLQMVQPAVAEPVLQPVMETYAETESTEESSDPFQRRIDNALRQGFGGRDSRVLSLGLSGLLTRA